MVIRSFFSHYFACWIWGIPWWYWHSVTVIFDGSWSPGTFWYHRIIWWRHRFWCSYYHFHLLYFLFKDQSCDVSQGSNLVFCEECSYLFQYEQKKYGTAAHDIGSAILLIIVFIFLILHHLLKMLYLRKIADLLP